MYSMNSTIWNYNLQLKGGTIPILDEFIASGPMQAIIELSTSFLRDINISALKLALEMQMYDLECWLI